MTGGSATSRVSSMNSWDLLSFFQIVKQSQGTGSLEAGCSDES